MPGNSTLDATRERVESADDAAWTSVPATDEAILRMRQSVIHGQHWFEALLEAVGRWRVPDETIGERTYRYLVLGEAFDWLLLAERLLDEMPDLVPPRESAALLFHNRWPIELDDADFAERLGPAQAQRSPELPVRRTRRRGASAEHRRKRSTRKIRNRPWGQDTRVDETMFERVYGRTRDELFEQFYVETGEKLRQNIALADWTAFRYWLFKQRLRRQDKARVASDTRKGLAQLTRMELAVSERRHGAHLPEMDFAARYSA